MSAEAGSSTPVRVRPNVLWRRLAAGAAVAVVVAEAVLAASALLVLRARRAGTGPSPGHLARVAAAAALAGACALLPVHPLVAAACAVTLYAAAIWRTGALPRDLIRGLSWTRA